MGYGLPAAIGACIANGKQPMVAVESDGSLQLNVQELATLKAQNLPICLVVMNNGGYASIRNTQRNYFESRHVGTGPEAGLWMPDLERIAATYDLPFRRISDAAELAPVLNEVLAKPQAMIVDVQLTPNEVLAPKCAALPQPDGSMLSMPLEDMSPLLSIEELEAQMLVPLLPQSYKARQLPPRG
jgi:acetolactate synthase-1/2/3 large subunit